MKRWIYIMRVRKENKEEESGRMRNFAKDIKQNGYKDLKRRKEE